MKKAIALLSAVMVSLMLATAGFAGDMGGENQPDYKAVPKEMHENAFPSGHPAVERWTNHCYYSVNDELYFCADNIWQ